MFRSVEQARLNSAGSTQATRAPWPITPAETHAFQTFWSFLPEAIEGLKGQQQQILKLRFNEGKTQTEIADHIGVSQMHVSRLLRRALEDLRRELDELENNH